MVDHDITQVSVSEVLNHAESDLKWIDVCYKITITLRNFYEISFSLPLCVSFIVECLFCAAIYSVSLFVYNMIIKYPNPQALWVSIKHHQVEIVQNANSKSFLSTHSTIFDLSAKYSLHFLGENQVLIICRIVCIEF